MNEVSIIGLDLAKKYFRPTALEPTGRLYFGVNCHVGGC